MKTVSVAINAKQTMGNIGVSEMGVGCLFRSLGRQRGPMELRLKWKVGSIWGANSGELQVEGKGFKAQVGCAEWKSRGMLSALGRAENRPEVGSWVTARSRGTIYGHRKELGFIVSAMETCGCFQRGESYDLCFTGPHQQLWTIEGQQWHQSNVLPKPVHFPSCR